MKRYIDKVIRLFWENDYSRKTIGEFHRWLLKEDDAEAKNDILKQAWDGMSVRKDKNTGKAFDTFLYNIGMDEVMEEKKHLRINVWKYASAAAVVSCMVSTAATYMLADRGDDKVAMVECYVPKTKTREVVLPDGTMACLNSGSYILYPEGFKGDVRDVYLVGEAVFDVAKDKEKPFVVHSNEVAVTALGTKFNVKAYPEDDFLTATLLQGKVKVDCDDTGCYYLEPGQQLKHNKLTHDNELKDVDGDFVTAWQRGEIILSEATLPEIGMALEAKYGIEFRLFASGDVNTDLYSFTFKKDATIEEVLEILKIVVRDFDYKIKDNVCNIYRN